RAPDPVPNAWTPSLPLPGRITSFLQHGTPPGACQGPGCAAPRTGAAHPVRVLSDTQLAPDYTPTVHAESGKAGEHCPGFGRGVERGYRSVPPPTQRSLWWQAAMLPR